MINAIATPFGLFLKYIYGFVNNYGWSIVIFTIFVKLLLLPLTLKQTQSMKKMQALNPKIKELQKKYAKDKQKLNEKTMELYKKENANPASGCFPLLIQFPVLIALFQVLRKPEVYVFTPEAYANAIKNFLWLPNLSQPDPYYILPVLAAATTYYQTKMTNTQNAQNPTQNTMTIVMPLMIGWFALKFPSGLALYWVLSNIFQIVQQYYVMKPAKAVKEESN